MSMTSKWQRKPAALLSIALSSMLYILYVGLKCMAVCGRVRQQIKTRKTEREKREMESKTAVADKPHAVCIPGPVQSHIKAMLKFSKLLCHKGFHKTFVNTEFNHQRFVRSGGPNSLDGLPDFQFRTIPDSLPPSDSNATQDIPSLCDSIMKYFLAPFSDFLVKLNAATSNNPPVTCIISDGFMQFTVTAVQELRIPIVMLFTIPACSLMGFMQFSPLRERGLTPLKGVA
jgi:hypothetical protein